MGSACLTTEKVLILEPNEIRFGGPLLRPTITLVTLKNPNNFDVMYKFKTTAPRIYRVRPNLGIVNSHGDKTVRIVLMPFSFDLKERLVHKFMVLTSPAPDDFSDLRTVWAGLDEAKLRCEKFKSIIEMSRPLAPISLEICSSSTSAEYEQEAPASCCGYTSQSDDNVHSENLTPTNATITTPPITPRSQRESTPRIAVQDATLEKEATLRVIRLDREDSTTELEAPSLHNPHLPKEFNRRLNIEPTSVTIASLEKDVVLGELRAENQKLRDLNDILRRENKKLTFELERFRNVKMEAEGSMAVSVKGPKRSASSGGKTNKLMLFLATSMTMAIVCAMIGKFVFPDKVNLEGLQNFLESVVN